MNFLAIVGLTFRTLILLSANGIKPKKIRRNGDRYNEIS